MVDIAGFVREWCEGWNSHDLDRIMIHYRDDIVFRSLKAIDVVGVGKVRGKDELRTYWNEALKRQPALRFSVEGVFTGFNMIVVLYRNHRGVLATETMYFDESGAVYQAAACHMSAAA